MNNILKNIFLILFILVIALHISFYIVKGETSSKTITYNYDCTGEYIGVLFHDLAHNLNLNCKRINTFFSETPKERTIIDEMLFSKKSGTTSEDWARIKNILIEPSNFETIFSAEKLNFLENTEYESEIKLLEVDEKKFEIKILSIIKYEY